MWLPHASISRWEKKTERVSSIRAFWAAYLTCHYEVEMMEVIRQILKYMLHNLTLVFPHEFKEMSLSRVSHRSCVTCVDVRIHSFLVFVLSSFCQILLRLGVRNPASERVEAEERHLKHARDQMRERPNLEEGGEFKQNKRRSLARSFLPPFLARRLARSRPIPGATTF